MIELGFRIGLNSQICLGRSLKELRSLINLCRHIIGLKYVNVCQLSWRMNLYFIQDNLCVNSLFSASEYVVVIVMCPC